MPEPTDFDLDAAISADLDGELAAMCTEAGLEPDAVRARLTTPEATARRAELVAARTALATPVEPLDDLARHRLVTRALDGAGPETTVPTGSVRHPPSGHSGRRWGIFAGVAAAVLVIVAIVAIVATGEDSANSGGSSTASAPTGNLGNVGTLNQRGVDALVNGSGTSTKSNAAAPSADGFTEQSGAVPTDRVAACADRYRADGTVRFQASGLFEGQPAVILGIDTDTRTIVFVVAADDCGRVLYSASR
jgi:hypothetical protein